MAQTNTSQNSNTVRLDLSLLGKTFSVQCDAGEEARVEALAGYVDGKLRQLAGSQSSATENRMLMLCCLMLADEVFELRKTGGKSTGSSAAPTGEMEGMLVAAVEDLNRRLEGLAAKLAAI